MISQLISKIFDLIILLLFISVLLTWIPNIKWNQEPFRALKSFTDMFFAPFRRIIPPIGMPLLPLMRQATATKSHPAASEWYPSAEQTAARHGIQNNLT